jgi:YVTN family beta-propeller protein
MPARRLSLDPRSYWPAVIGALALLLTLPPVASAVSLHSTAIDITPDGNEVWVVNPDHGTVAVLNTIGTVSLIQEVPTGPEPWCVDITPDGTEAWVTSMGDNAVYVVDTFTKTVIDTIPNLGFETFGVAFNPAGTVALVTASGSDQIFAVDVATRAVTNTFAAYRRPRGIAWRPDGERAWVTHLLMPEFSGRLTTVFPATWTTANISIQPVFGPPALAGYPSTMQNITLAPPPNDDTLWLPSNMINTSAGGFGGVLLSPTNIFHAVIRPVNARARARPRSERYSPLPYWLPRSLWKTSPAPGRRVWSACSKASATSPARRWRANDQPTMRRVQRSMTTAR